MRTLVVGLALCLAAVGLACSRAHAEGGHGDADGGAAAHHSGVPAKAEGGSGHESPAAAAAAHGAVATSGHGATHGAGPPSGHAGHGPGSAEGARRGGYVVPFTWDTSEDEPLARMRGFMRGLVHDNGRYVDERREGFFKAFASGQKPRATLVTCSDSRVQSPAFDATPENDVFTIRNIGNQVVTAEGSVEYGVHHLKTPTLVVLGHVGCGAVKAALGDFSRESAPIVRELSSLTVPKAAAGQSPEEALKEGVVSNVNAQVSVALLKFGEEVERGDLTVVGAVFDFKNELGHGYGRIHVVNVNGQTDKERVDAFTRAMSGRSAEPRGEPRADPRAADKRESATLRR